MRGNKNNQSSKLQASNSLRADGPGRPDQARQLSFWKVEMGSSSSFPLESYEMGSSSCSSHQVFGPEGVFLRYTVRTLPFLRHNEVKGSPLRFTASRDRRVTNRYSPELLNTGSPLGSHLLCQKPRGVQKEPGVLERCCAALERGQSPSILFKRRRITSNPPHCFCAR